MKISKVDHTNTGVGKLENNGRGMLYNNPDLEKSGNASIDVKERIKKLNEKAQGLYNLFGCVEKYSFDPTYHEKFFWGSVAKNMREMIKALAKKKDEQEQFVYLKNYHKEIELENKNYKYTCKLIEKFTEESLRKSFRKKVVLKNGTTVAMKNIVDHIICSKLISCKNAERVTVTDEELQCFLELLNKDYKKEKQIKNTVKAIYAQDTKVQVFDDEEKQEKLLAISSHAKDKKKPLFDFMITYVNGDEKQRKDLREEKRQFIWEYLETGHNDDVVFSEKIENELIRWCNMSEKISRTDKSKVRDLIREELCAKYKEMNQKVENIADEGKEQYQYWLNFFAAETEKYIGKIIAKYGRVNSSIPGRKIVLKDLFSHLYKYWLTYMAQKYIELGKGVLNFSNLDYQKENGQIGKVRSEYETGITSFDYELISAEDSLKRELATYVMFAVYNFGTSVFPNSVLKCDGKEDPLANHKELVTASRENAVTLILRYFGGASNWNELLHQNKTAVLGEFVAYLASLRNSVIHFGEEYSNEAISQNTKQGIVKTMFSKEYEGLGKNIAQKYCSNNVLQFYDADKVSQMMENLYHRRTETAGVPAFSRIVPRSKVHEFIQSWTGKNQVEICSKDVETAEKYRSAIYFCLKDIYYYGFLCDDKKNSHYLYNALGKLEKCPADVKRTYDKAYSNYQERYNGLRHTGISGTQICEQIMRDFALQNDREYKVADSSDKKAADNEKYQHFRMMLYRQIKLAFIDYLNDEENVKIFGFLKNPQIKSDNGFAKNPEVKLHAKLKEQVQDDDNLLAWYVTAHFLNKRQLNFLCGTIRTYIRYVSDVSRRARSTDNPINDIKQRKEKYRKILAVLEFTMNYVEQTTNKLEDYFVDEQDYEEQLKHFVKLEQDEVRNSKLYFDDKNPILNKNIVKATMYGGGSLFEADVIKKVCTADIEEYEQLKKDLENVFKNGTCKTKADQKNLRRFQNIKNRVELTNVVEYVEILNDLYGQLCSWTYLRERDLLYMQLGYYYTKLYWGNAEENAKFNTCDSIPEIKRGAILYMIKAMYSHEKNNIDIHSFLELYKDDAYLAGLELFEDITRSQEEMASHNGIVKMRNYIAHFKYFSKLDYSMEELYGYMFNDFFFYNPNFHKSIPVIYQNILAKHKLIAQIELKPMECKGLTNKEELKNMPHIKDDQYSGKRIKKGMKSEVLTFKNPEYKAENKNNRSSYKNGNRKNENPKAIQLPAHEEDFIDNVRRMLEYKSW